MDDHSNAELVVLIEKQLDLLKLIHASITVAVEHDVPLLGRTGNAAILVAGLIESYYTCLETAFQKISQHLGSHPEPVRWHASMLEKMTLRLEGIQAPDNSAGNRGAFLELRHIRHFSRHYLEPEKDWNLLDIILRELEAEHPTAVTNLERFGDFVRGG